MTVAISRPQVPTGSRVTLKLKVITDFFDENIVLVNDPAFPDASKEVPREEFLSAWAAADRLMIKIDRSDA